MRTTGNRDINADDDGWADDMVERWFEEFDEQGDEPARRTDQIPALGAAPA